jgi:protein-S-isoprenylcysteine O-methyltransferase Ste14
LTGIADPVGLGSAKIKDTLTSTEPFRWILGVVLALGLGISGFYRHKARASGETIRRSSESWPLILGRVVFGVPLYLSLLAYLIQPRWLAWSEMSLPIGWRWLGAALGFASIPLIYWVVSSLGRNISETTLTKREHELVARGPYRWVRHPLYTTGSLLMLGAALLTDSWFVLIIALLGGAMLRFLVIPREEAALIAKFGERYIDYSRRTGRLLPRLRPAR